MDDSVFNRIFSAAAGVWALAAMVAVALFKAWPAILGRFNERYRDRVAEEAGDWERIRHERDVAREERDIALDRRAEAEAKAIHWMGRAVKAEAIVQGYGEARQLQALDEAMKRLAPKEQGDD